MIMINIFRPHAFPKKTADSPHKLADILTCCCRDLIFDSLLCMLDNIFSFCVSLISFDILPNWNYAAITSVKSPPYIEDLSFLLSRCLSHIPLSSAVVIIKGSHKAGYIRLFTGYQTDPASFLSLPSGAWGLDGTRKKTISCQSLPGASTPESDLTGRKPSAQWWGANCSQSHTNSKTPSHTIRLQSQW